MHPWPEPFSWAWGSRARPTTSGSRLAAAGFGGLPSRCHSLGRVGGVEFVDDGLSTNVLPAQAALRAFEQRPVALLVGGYDRGVDYSPLGQTIAHRTAPTLVVTMPDNGLRIGAAVREAGDGAVEVTDAASLEDAVEAAFAWAGTGAVVLLSPAAPSFGRYGDYQERSAAFAGPPPGAARSAEPAQQGAVAGASSSRSLRNSHHESADTIAAACTTSGSAPSSDRASRDHPACSTS